MANRFLDSFEAGPVEAPKGSSNRFLSSIEGVEIPHTESFGKASARTALQAPLGYAKKYTWPADVFKLLSEGASREVLAQLQEQEPELKSGIAEQARQRSMEYLPTQDLAERLIEEKTGIPLQAKNELQKKLRLAGSAAGFRPGGLAAKGTAAVVAPGVSTGLESIGAPEGVAEFGGLLASGAAPVPSLQKAVKPSGMPLRQFEKVSKPTKVSPARHEKIIESVENDFRKVADEILGKNKTYSAMKEDTQFVDKIEGLLEKTEDLASQVPGKVLTDEVRNAFKSRYNKREVKGISPDEYEIAFRRNVRDINKQIPQVETATAKDLFDQFRKNNRSLKELFEPGKSSAQNRAKRDAILEYNRAIEDVINKKYPDTEFRDLFEFTNRRWSEILNVREIEGYMNDLFNGKVDFNKARQVLNNKDSKPSRALRQTLGEEGFNDFKGLLGDLMTSERALGYIKKAESAGFKEFIKAAGAYLIHPTVAKLHLAGKIAKSSWQTLLDKPELIVKWRQGIESVKKSQFSQAEKIFKDLDKELKADQKDQEKSSSK